MLSSIRRLRPPLQKSCIIFLYGISSANCGIGLIFQPICQGITFTKKLTKNFCGEASPTYLFYPTVPSRMKEILPDVKLIVILRNPVDRAYSHYHHMLRRNNESLSFEKAIESEKERCAGERERLIKNPDFVPVHYRNHSYLARGVYADQLENWFRHYGRGQFLILTQEDLRKNSQQTLDQVF